MQMNKYTNNTISRKMGVILFQRKTNIQMYNFACLNTNQTKTSLRLILTDFSADQFWKLTLY